MPKKTISEMKKKFNFRKKINGTYYDQIEHTSSIKKAKALKKHAIKKGYDARVRHHPLKKDDHYDVYVKKNKKKKK